MGRFLTALLALTILTTVPPRAAEETPFAVTTQGLTFTEKVASLTVLPGADLDLQVVGHDGP